MEGMVSIGHLLNRVPAEYGQLSKLSGQLSEGTSSPDPTREERRVKKRVTKN